MSEIINGSFIFVALVHNYIMFILLYLILGVEIS